MWGVWAPGASVPCGKGAGAPPFAGPGLIARVGLVKRCRRVLGGLAWRRLVLGEGGGGGPPSSMDPPRRGVVAEAAGGMRRVTVSGGFGPGGPPGVDVVAGGIRWLVRGAGPRWYLGYAGGALGGCHPIRWCCSCTGVCGPVG